MEGLWYINTPGSYFDSLAAERWAMSQDQPVDIEGDLRARTLLARHLGHDLPHLHGLAGWDFLNADDDLVIGCACGSLE